jgi:hypothetical protein
MTVFYSDQDIATLSLLNYFLNKKVLNVEWNFVALPKEQLFRRSIGRNIAAKQTKADWIWFADSDVLFYEDALDTLSDLLTDSKEILVYPRRMWVSSRLEEDHELIQLGKNRPGILSIDRQAFSPREYNRAIGPAQIVCGNVARALGYCDSLDVYQKTTNRWRKTYEDRAFRWLLGVQGTALDIPNLYYIRHVEKGRYRGGGVTASVRKSIRKIQFNLFDR